jgi:hypothetical protein
MFIPGSPGGLLSRAALPAIEDSIWYPGEGPPAPLAFSPDPTSTGVNLGVMIATTVRAEVLAVCYWRWSDLQASNGVVALWIADNELTEAPVLIASKGFTDHTGTGWKRVEFDAPVEVQTNHAYKASIWIPKSADGYMYYGGTPLYFLSKTYYSPNGLMWAWPNIGQPYPPHGIYKHNGLYKYGAFACPDDTYSSGNYWVDVVLRGSPAPNPPLPPIVLKWEIPEGYPDETNTGVPPGTVLTDFIGTIATTADGQIIENLNVINGGISVRHHNVTVRKCKVFNTGGLGIGVNTDCLGTIIEDCDLDAGGRRNSAASNIGGGPLSVRRCNMYRAVNGLAHFGSYGPGSPTQIFEDNFIHTLRASPGSPHYDCMQFNGGQYNIIIRHNTLHNENTDTSAILIENLNGPIDGMLIEDNIMCGGGYTSYCVGRTEDPLDNPVTVQYYNNQWRIGAFGYLIDTQTTPITAGNRFMDHGGIYDSIPPGGFTEGQIVRERFFGMPNGASIIPGSIVYDAVPGITLGVSFQVEHDTTIVGVNFPKIRSPGETIGYKVGVWRFTGANRNAGTELLYQETINFMSGARGGWEHLPFTTPVTVDAWDNILLGVWSPPGADGRIWFSSVGGVFGDNVVSQFGRATAFNGAGVPYNGFTSGNGLFNYGPDLAPPLNQTSGRPSYNVDPIFEALWTGNDPPTATNLSADEAYSEDTLHHLVDIVVTDIDSPNVTVAMVLSNPAAGSLTTATSNAVTSSYISGVWAASGAIADVNVLLESVAFMPAAGFNSSFSIATSVSDGVAPAITGTKVFTCVPPVVLGAIPLTWDDPRFAANTSSDPVTMSSGTLLRKSITETGFSASILASNNIIVDTCRVNSREGVRVAGSGVDIRNSYLESLGEGDDHADTVQAYSPGERGSHIQVTNSSIVAHTTAATAGMFVADNWGGTVTLNNVVFNGGPFGCRIHADGTATVNVYMKDVFFVGPFGFAKMLIRAEPGGTLNITHWENVRDATIVGGVLVPGDLIPAPGGAVNAAPTATNLSAAESYTEDTPLNLINIVVSDADSADVTAILTMSNTFAGSLSTATSGTVTSTYNAGTGVWTASGPIADVNTLLAGVIFTPTANFNSNFIVTTSVSDGVAPAITGTKAFTGIPVGDAPTATNLSVAETYTEDTTLDLIDIVVSDIDSPNVTVTLTLSNPAAGSLSTATSGTVTSTYVAGVWTASGPTVNVNTLLAGVVFTPAASFNSNFTIATSVSDGVLAATGTKAFTAVPVNDPPTATNLSAAETYTEDTPLNLINIVVSDIDSPNVTVTLTLSNPAAGSLSTATSGSVTSTYNAGTGVWTAAGAIANVNTLLAGVAFTPTANFNSNFSIATSVSDGVAPAITGTKAFTGTAVGDAPTATNLSAAETYNEGTPLNLINIVVSDVDSPNVTATLTLSNPAAGSLSTATSGAVTSTYNAGTGVWTASGAVANVNTLLAGVVFTPTAGFSSNFTVATSISDGALTTAGTKAFTGTPTPVAGSIPLTYSDARFASNTTSASVTLSSGTLLKKSITDTGATASIVAEGNVIIDTCRVNSAECVRMAGNVVDIRNSYLEATGSGEDHADVIQAYDPGQHSGQIKVSDTSIVAHTTAATAGLFIADDWGGTVTLINVVFNGGPFGCRIHADSGCTVNVYMKDVFFVGPFGFDKLLIQAEPGGTLNITHWENVRDATIAGGVLVPGALIPEP